jgi:DNA repair protein RadC
MNSHAHNPVSGFLYFLHRLCFVERGKARAGRSRDASHCNARNSKLLHRPRLHQLSGVALPRGCTADGRAGGIGNGGEPAMAHPSRSMSGGVRSRAPSEAIGSRSGAAGLCISDHFLGLADHSDPCVRNVVPSRESESRLLRSALEEFLALELSKTRDLVDAIFREFGSVSDALAASPVRLAKVIGQRPAERLLSFSKLSRAVFAERVNSRPWLPLEELAAYANQHIGYARNERAFVFYIDAAGHVIQSGLVAEGITTSTLVNVRTMIVEAVECGSCALVLAHNHPSGVLRPSRGDLAFTQRLQRMANDFDMRLIDHLIVGRGRAYSISRGRDIDLSSACDVGGRPCSKAVSSAASPRQEERR